MLQNYKNLKEKYFERFIEDKLKPSELKVFETQLDIDSEMKEEFIEFLSRKAGQLGIEMDSETLKSYLDNKLTAEGRKIFLGLATFSSRMKQRVIWELENILGQWDFETWDSFFDAHLFKELTSEQEKAFKLYLELSAEFKKEYKIFRFGVEGIKEKGSREDKRFFEAMNSISVEELQKIVENNAEEIDPETGLALALTGVDNMQPASPEITLTKASRDMALTDFPYEESEACMMVNEDLCCSEAADIFVEELKEEGTKPEYAAENPSPIFMPEPVAYRSAARPNQDSQKEQERASDKANRVSGGIRRKWLWAISGVAVAAAVAIPVSVAQYHKAQIREIVDQYLVEINQGNIEENLGQKETGYYVLTSDNIVSDYSTLLTEENQKALQNPDIDVIIENLKLSKDAESKFQNGTLLILAYIKEHKIGKAETTLKDLIKENKDFSTSRSNVSQKYERRWKNLLADLLDLEEAEPKDVGTSTGQEAPGVKGKRILQALTVEETNQ